MVSIISELQKAREDLIDQGLRNTMINYRHLKSSGIAIVDEQSPSIYQLLVCNNKSMEFLPNEDLDQIGNAYFTEVSIPPGYYNPKIESINYYILLGLEISVITEADLISFESNETSDARYTDQYLQTNYSTHQLQKRLLKTYYKATTYIEEQGVNVLFIALGMLRWYESEVSDIERSSPLVLIPVKLSRSSVNARFVIKYTDDGIGGNLSLQAKLKSDFGLEIDLPQVDETQDENDFDISEYFALIEGKIEGHSRWKVDRDAIVLGFFSYAKYLMFSDLDPGKWPNNILEKHNILSKLLGDGFSSTLSNQIIEYSREEIDTYLLPENNFHVLDADSSQTQAILLAKQGGNLVIQGPPGTGKSQTIANIIAEFVGNGKTVLFVAEKMAALEVVMRRLEAVDIGDLCLALHSHKANKRTFLDELEKTLNIGAIKGNNVEIELEDLQNVRERLNAYSDAVNIPIGDSEITPYQVYGNLLRTNELLSDIELPIWENSEIGKWSATDYKDKWHTVENLQIALQRIGKPAEHSFWGSQLKIILPSTKDNILRGTKTALDSLNDVIKSAKALALNLGSDMPTSLLTCSQLCKTTEKIVNLPMSLDINWKSTEWINSRKSIKELIRSGLEVRAIKDKYDKQLIPQAWDQDLLSIRSAIKSHGNSLFRGLMKDYRKSINLMKGLFVDQMPRGAAAQLAVIDDIMQVQKLSAEIDSQETLYSTLFPGLWKGESSDWDKLKEIADSLVYIHRAVNKNILPIAVFTLLENPEKISSIKSDAKDLRANLTKYFADLKKAFADVMLDVSECYETSNGFKSQPLAEQVVMFEQWISCIDEIADMAFYNQQRQKMIDMNLEKLLKVATIWEHAAEHLTSFFDRNYYMQIIEIAMLQRDVLSNFNRESHEQLLNKFRSLDGKTFKNNRVQILENHFSTLSTVNMASGQVATIKREFNKKRRHKPIRRLIREAGQAIQALKPVFMMSPMSIATYLPPTSIKFDLVIFDEASQIRPAEALGAIVRGSQVIVVGDSKQLPPTSFFDSIKDNEDENAFTSHTESILGLFKAQGAKEQMLRWHYRSQHESLIATSNYEFYNNRLYIFPSPEGPSSSESGLIFHHLPTTHYESGRGKSYNRGEALEVARAVMKHSRNSPKLTLGVAAFSQAQTQAIRDELERLRRGNPETEVFFNSHVSEPFFVKNLENVQGDERDVMFISIGYGKQSDGRLSMNFGPLNRDGGERRLNVLITRAKKRCEIFTNLRHFDIDLNRSKSIGVSALKRYLKYAETGDLDIPKHDDGASPDSVFEELVANELRNNGYTVHHQVGSAGFFIDLAILDEEHSGRYILGIECDGASYHSSASARERDRLRQAILESKGWRIHRIWSTDWFRNPGTEIEKVIQAIEDAKNNADISDVDEQSDEQLEPMVLERVKRNEIAKHDESDKFSLAPYQRAELRQLSYSDIEYVPSSNIQELIIALVEIEAPIHIKEAIKRVANALGFNRTGSKIKQRLTTIINTLAFNNSVTKSGDFLLKANSSIVPRNRSDIQDLRKIDLVYPGEIKILLSQIVENTIGIQQDELIQEACSYLGFGRVSSKSQKYVHDIIKVMIADSDLKIENDHIFIDSSD